MTSRERITLAMDFQKTDRVPRYEIFLPDFIDTWHNVKNMPADFDINDYYNQIDIGVVAQDQNGPYLSSSGIMNRNGHDYYEHDSWGRLLHKKDNAYFENEIEAIVTEKGHEPPFDTPKTEMRKELITWVGNEKQKRFCMVSGVLGLFMGCSRLRGQTQFLFDIAEDVPYCIYLANKLADFTLQAGFFAAENTNTKDTALWVYDEFSSRIGPMFSPTAFETIFLPVYKRIITAWKKAGIHKVILHCDGNSLPLLDLIIEAGFDGLQSLAPTAGMWLPDVKAQYDKKLVLIGGMCNISTLASGTRGQIENEAAAILEAARDGGVIIGTHSIDYDIPIANYDIYDTYMREHNKD
jgi:hypothetical protein